MLDSVLKEQAVFVQKVQEHCGRDALVPIAKGMVLCDKIQKVGGLFLRGGINVLSAKSLVNGADAALERLVLFVPKEVARVAKLHRVYYLAGLLVSDAVGVLSAAGLFYARVVVVVQQVKGAGVLLYHGKDLA